MLYIFILCFVLNVYIFLYHVRGSKRTGFFFFSLLLYLLYHSKGCYIICNSCMLHGTDAKPCSLMGHLALNLNNKLFSFFHFFHIECMSYKKGVIFIKGTKCLEIIEASDVVQTISSSPSTSFPNSIILYS